MSRFASFLCRVLGHQWSPWGDNGCYTIHEDAPDYPYHDHLLTRFCARCERMQSVLAPVDQRGHEEYPVLTSPSPRPTSSWRYVTPEDTRESIEAWRAGTAATEAPAPEATPYEALPRLLDRAFAVPSGPTGEGRTWEWSPTDGWSVYDSWTGAHAPTDASSTSTARPSSGSPRSRRAS